MTKMKKEFLKEDGNLLEEDMNMENMKRENQHIKGKIKIKVDGTNNKVVVL